ncbi:50S ribosomal protein L9 [Halobacteriovorax sp. XZX-3]|uniref:50S ribosomal protein L9 n=1 Tax=unclassified Halobacteriovorax TaxID=2639665 RepID=UPI000CD154DE|nr:50S ribosomal protein L9 [Halobacteriovorax sp. DA5]POB14905.1 50S ribosomal protein L9 [Halobacteriovorax sp. DA5]
MKVILKETVKSLGNVGEIVNVSAGYARNFLIPNGAAVLADESNTAQVKHFEKLLAKQVEADKASATKVAGAINGLNIELIKRVGTNGKLFGSVTTHELSLELGKLGHDVERRHLLLENPIRAIGSYEVKAKVFAGVDATFTVTVKMDPAQEEENKKKAEELAAMKAAQELLAKEAAEAAASGDNSGEMSEEEKLKMEANRILRS